MYKHLGLQVHYEFVGLIFRESLTSIRTFPNIMAFEKMYNKDKTQYLCIEKGYNLVWWED